MPDFKFAIGDYVQTIGTVNGAHLEGWITRQIPGKDRCGDAQAHNYHFKMPNGKLNHDGYFEWALELAEPPYAEDYRLAVQVLGEAYFF